MRENDQTPGARAPGARAALARLRGDAAPHPLDARALAALAANPGCARRAVLDAAGLDKSAIAASLGAPAPFGQSPFAITRGLAFERQLLADDGSILVDLLATLLADPAAAPSPETVRVTAPPLPGKDSGPATREARTRQALDHAAPGEWTVLYHPTLSLDVAGAPAYLEPDALVVRPDGRWTVVEIKSFPILDGTADPAKVGAAARQAAVYLLALDSPAADQRFLLVCPRDFGNRPTGSLIDLRRELGVTRRQLERLTRIEELLAPLPEDAVLDPGADPARLTASVEAIPAAYTPDCLSTCDLAFHCRDRARAAGSVDVLGRGARAEAAPYGQVAEALGGSDRLVRAGLLRAEALALAGPSAEGPGGDA
ncbi:hypothetical protein [Phaeacidiphilus oryzae]|uniref:hypothetical protein n=1 Tax=Phaeacidiphilus oryzae TaxID=348818 RepID=UPI000691D97B|nr:hypothetical protein [Phaeacidiphilus oryzae]